MVAVQTPNRASDAALASELGSLLLAHTRIRDVRWRLDAIVRRVPALVRFGVSLDSTRAAIRDLGARAPCPAPLRDLVLELLERHFDAAFVRALWLPDWKSCARLAGDAALRLSDEDGLRRIVAIVASRRYVTPRVVRRSTLAEVIAHVDEGRWDDAERVARGLRAGEQPYARAHLARLELRRAAIEDVGRIAFRALPFREASIRAGARLLLVRELVARACFAEARALADAIERPLIRQLAYIEIARGLVLRDVASNTQRGLAMADDAAPSDVECGLSMPCDVAPSRIAPSARHRLSLPCDVAPNDIALSAQRDLSMSYDMSPSDIAPSAHSHVVPSEQRRPAMAIPSAELALPLSRTAGHRRVSIGPIVDALRLLNTVTRPELVGERELLRAEVRLMVRREREDGVRVEHPAWEVPLWLRPQGWLPGEQRDRRYLAIAFIRMALRDGLASTLDLARDEVRRVPPVAVLELLPRVGVEIDVAIARLASGVGDLSRARGAIDALQAERIAMRATELACTTRELPEPMRLGLAGLPTDDNDGRSIERAWFDEGLALSASAPRRRRVLIGVAQSALRNARTQDLEVLRARLRTLVHLGGTLGADALAKSLALPIHAPTWLEALDALCAIDAKRAGDIVLARYLELRRASVDPQGALDRVVAHGGIRADRATAFVATLRVLEAALGDRMHPWFADFTRLWHTRTGSAPDDDALAWIRTCDVHREPAVLLDDLDELRARALAGDARTIAERLSLDARTLRALLLDGPRVDRRMKPWPLANWQSLLSAASTLTLEIDVGILRRIARMLGHRNAERALLSGDLASLGVPALSNVHAGNRWLQLRLLDKRRDLLTYLRFADTPARSCLRSDSWMYPSTEFGKQAEIIEAWRDPLTLCFHVEHDARVIGFIFGNLAEIESAPAVLLNSLHVRPNTPVTRIAILRAIEHALAPLRIRAIGVANWHNGEGELPDDYAYGARRGVRLRALATDGEPVAFVNDDISLTVNKEQVIELYWRDLERSKS
jgi:hypothetical protein